MAFAALAIDGRLVTGGTLRAAVWGVENVQWQALVNGVWTNVGTLGSVTYTIPSNAAGTAYRVVGTGPDGPVTSTVTGNVTVDTKKISAPVLSGNQDLAAINEEGPGQRSIFSWLTFSDADRTSYSGGSLLLQSTSATKYGGDGLDVLSIRFLGVLAGQFSFNAATREVKYAFSNGVATTIGTLDAVLNGADNDLKVTFNGNATHAVIDALINNLQFSNNDDSPGSRLFTLRVTDAQGGSVQRVTSVTIGNTPDAPVFTSPAAFTVDENQAAVGTIAAIDPDLDGNQSLGVAYSLTPNQGPVASLFTIDSVTGALRFNSTPDFENPFPALSFTLQVRATDSAGTTSDQAVAITIRDVAEAPVAANILASISEDGPSILIASGAYDQDAGDSLSYSIDTSSTFGAVTLEGSSFRYDTNGRFNHLQVNASFNDRFTYTVTDETGHAVTRTVTVTVQGANDAPLAAVSPTSLLAEAGANGNGQASASGTAVTFDIDGDPVTFALTTPANYGWLLLTESGNWTYILDNGNATVQALTDYQILEDTVTIEARDPHGGATPSQVKVLIFGSNDAPVVVDAQFSLQNIVEAGAAGPGYAVSTSSVAGSATDPEGDALSWVASVQDGQFGTFTLGSDGTVRYQLDNARADLLVQGQRVSESFVATVRDTNGATASRTLTYDIRGSNDNALISGGTFGYVMEDGLLATGGTLSVFDPDAWQSSLVAVEGGVGSAGGTFNVAAGGEWTYSLANASAAVQGLRSGDTLDDTITVTSLDGTAQQVLTVTIYGTDDAPVFLGTTGLAVTEDAFDASGFLTVGANIGLVDPDAGQGEVVPFTSQGGPWSLGTFSMTAQGEWTWSSHANPWQIESLAEGQTLTDMAGFTTLDGTFGLLSVFVTGQNDAPNIAGGETQGFVVEPGGFPPELPPPPTTATGTLWAWDMDNGDVLAWSGSAEGLYGSFAIDVAGNWTYTVDAVKSDVLVMGESAFDYFTATVSDDHGGTATQTISINVYGGNEVPVVDPSSTLAATVQELPAPDGTLVLDWSSATSYGELAATDAAGGVLLLSYVDVVPGYTRKTLSRFNEDGSLDTAFGAGGHTQFEWPIQASDLQVDAQGRIVAAGYSSYNYGGSFVDFAATRILADGTLDASFGVGGVVNIDIAGGYEYAHDVFLRPDGGMFLVGSGGSGMVVVSLDANGNIDPSFGDGGKWFMPTGNYWKQVTMDAAGRFLAWSTENDPETWALEVHVERYLADGSPDLGFGELGSATVAVPWGSAYGADLEVAPDGGIIVAISVPVTTYEHPQVVLSRLHADGSRDEDFGDFGHAYTGVWAGPQTLAVDDFGRIVVAGQEANNVGEPLDFMMARFHADGTADTSFGNGGSVVTDVSGVGLDDYVNRLLLNPDGTILLAGATNEPTYDVNPALVRYTTDGQLDTGFGVGVEPTVTGWIMATDPDPNPYGYGQLKFTALTEGAFGTFSLMSPDYGYWTYTLDSDRATTQALEEGQAAQDTITVAIRDAMGGTTYQDIVVTVIGSSEPMAAPPML